MGRDTTRAMFSHPIHVRCTNTGTWFVQPDDCDPISAHGNETDAERAALEHAKTDEDAYVVIHDRYSRVHMVRPEVRKPPRARGRR
jgi:hypothetical protein